MGKIIDKLTPAQEKQLDVYFERYTKIGLATHKGKLIPHATLRKNMDAIYAAGGLKPPHLVVQVEGGPATCALAIRRLGAMKAIDDVDEIDFGRAVTADARMMDEEELQAGVKGELQNFAFGSHDADWLASFMYYRRVLKLKVETEECLPLVSTLKHGWWLPYENAVVVGTRPAEQHFDRDGITLHRDGGPALSYPDGWGVYVLHGVNVPKWLAVTPAEEIDPRRVAELTNAEVRREFVRKAGIDRICHACEAQVLDRQTLRLVAKDSPWEKVVSFTKNLIGLSGDDQTVEYELLLLKIPGLDGEREYLKMKNPSTGTWHIEGVPPGTRTVMAALTFRNGTDELPVRIT